MPNDDAALIVEYAAVDLPVVVVLTATVPVLQLAVEQHK